MVGCAVYMPEGAHVCVFVCRGICQPSRAVRALYLLHPVGQWTQTLLVARPDNVHVQNSYSAVHITSNVLLGVSSTFPFFELQSGGIEGGGLRRCFLSRCTKYACCALTVYMQMFNLFSDM